MRVVLHVYEVEANTLAEIIFDFVYNQTISAITKIKLLQDGITYWWRQVKITKKNHDPSLTLTRA